MSDQTAESTLVNKYSVPSRRGIKGSQYLVASTYRRRDAGFAQGCRFRQASKSEGKLKKGRS